VGVVCGRTTLTLSRDQVAELLCVERVDAPELPPSWNVAPTQPVFVAAVSTASVRQLRALRWGLIPNWAKDPRIGARLINARAETLSAKPAYREGARWRRGLAAFDGFYEWRLAEPDAVTRHASQPGSSRRRNSQGRAGRPSQPYYFRRTDGNPLVFCVLWDIWWDAEGLPLRSFSIVTTRANETMAPVHHRMPVILGPEHWDEWLQPSPLSPHRLGELLVPAADNLLSVHPVSVAVNSALHNGPELIEPRPVAETAEPCTLAQTEQQSLNLPE
jgi:putative SOS response-associated peptidase YedK